MHQINAEQLGGRNENRNDHQQNRGAFQQAAKDQQKKIDDEKTQQTIMMYANNYFDYTQIYRKEFPRK